MMKRYTGIHGFHHALHEHRRTHSHRKGRLSQRFGACARKWLGWIKRHIAKEKPVRGLIIAQHISDRIRYALADVPGVTAREYKLHITLVNVPHVDDAKI